MAYYNLVKDVFNYKVIAIFFQGMLYFYTYFAFRRVKNRMSILKVQIK